MTSCRNDYHLNGSTAKMVDDQSYLFLTSDMISFSVIMFHKLEKVSLFQENFMKMIFTIDIVFGIGYFGTLSDSNLITSMNQSLC